MKSQNKIHFSEAQARLAQIGIQCERTDNHFSISYYDNGSPVYKEFPVFIVPLCSEKKVSKRGRAQNKIKLLVCSLSNYDCSICSLTPRELSNHNWPAENVSCSGGLLLNAQEYEKLHEMILNLSKLVPEALIITESGWHGDSYAFGDTLIAKAGTDYATCVVDTGFSCADVGIDNTISNHSISSVIHDQVFKILNSGKIAAFLCIACLSLIYEDLRDRNPRLLPRFFPSYMVLQIMVRPP